MKTLRFDNQSPLATESQIQALEAKYGIRLPSEYREFLLTQGGGAVSDDNRVFYTPGKEEGLPVELLFSVIDEESEWGQLDHNMDTYLEREWQTGDPTDDTVYTMPRCFVPVADTCFGDYFCLGVEEPVSGQVFFWSHDSEGIEGVEEDARFGDFYLLTGDFASFIAGLENEDEE